MKINDFPQMKIRISPELKTKIEESAKQNNRTQNAEIISRLEESFDLLTSDLTEERVRELIREELARQSDK